MRNLVAVVAIVAGIILIAAGVALIARGDEMDDVAATTPGGTSTATGDSNEIAVTLQDFSVILGSESAKAGEITFTIKNIGPDFVHEFVIIQTDLEPGALPTEAEGFVDEGGAGIQVIDAIEDISVGDTQSLTVDLDAGSYVLICNIFDEPENESHYARGMRTAFAVE